MNTHDDLLNYNGDMCCLCEDDVSDMCSKDGHDTCGDGSSVGQHRRKARLYGAFGG